MELASDKPKDIVPVLDDPEVTAMMWTPYGERLQAKYEQRIMSFQCRHTGITTPVWCSTIRTTLHGRHQALVMESDNGKHFVAISKAQGCDERNVWDPHFIGWVRLFDGPFFGEAWDRFDTDVDGFYQDISGEDMDGQPLAATET